MHHIAVLHDVVLPFDPELPCFTRSLLSTVANEVIVGDCLRTDEAFFEVRVDHPCGLRCFGSTGDRPCSYLLMSCGREGVCRQPLPTDRDRKRSSRVPIGGLSPLRGEGLGAPPLILQRWE